ncbi:MAG: hypothetical protein R6W31_11020 [Bacteroidales bacterium]
MQLEIPLSEVQQFVRDQFHIDIDLKNIEENKIQVKYIDSVVLIIKEVKENVVLFYYELDGLATIVSKIAHLFLDKKLDKTPIEWDSKKKELKIDLNKFSELNTFLKFVFISKIHFIKETIVLEMYARGKS